MNKYNQLKEYLKTLKKVAVAYSSGVDSTFLLYAAIDALGIENVLAITASSIFIPEREKDEAVEWCKSLGVKHILRKEDVLSIPGVKENPANRCYLCKKALFSDFLQVAKEYGFEYVVEGSNMDDLGDYRPGMIAIKELDIKSPLREAQLYKQEIRDLSKQFKLPTWNKPSFACLASRFVYGELLEEKKLKMVDRAEVYLMKLGFKQFRVRIHNDLARIEVPQTELIKVIQHADEIDTQFKKIGFSYVSLDLKGYRTGSMNEVLKKGEV